MFLLEVASFPFKCSFSYGASIPHPGAVQAAGAGAGG